MAEIRTLADQHGIPVIEDAATRWAPPTRQTDRRALRIHDVQFSGDQAPDDRRWRLVTFLDESLAPLARRLRWFGIDRTDKQKGIWETISPR